MSKLQVVISKLPEARRGSTVVDGTVFTGRILDVASVYLKIPNGIVDLMDVSRTRHRTHDTSIFDYRPATKAQLHVEVLPE